MHQRDYSLSFKLAVVEKGEMIYRQAQDRYGTQDSSTVMKWLRKYGYPDRLSSPSTRTCRVNMPKVSLTPEQRIK